MFPRPGVEKILLYFLPLSFTVSLLSCDTNWSKKAGFTGAYDDLFVEKLQKVFKSADTSRKKGIGSIAENVKYAYIAGNFHPIWLKDKFATNDAAGKFIMELQDIRWDGMNPERFHLSALMSLKTKLDTTKQNSLNDAIAFDTTMTHNYLAVARELLLGEIIPKKADSLWYHANDSSWNAPNLLANSNEDYPSLDKYRSEVPTYNLLREEYERYSELAGDTELISAIEDLAYEKRPDSAMRANVSFVIHRELPWVETVPNDTITEEKQLIIAYQDYVGIRPTGFPDSTTINALRTPTDSIRYKICANMERIRWMQRTFGDLYIIVDVPLMQLFLRKDGANAMHMRVVVGKPERQTPSLYATMANVVINPPWGVPPTILKNDVVPGFAKSGKKYLAKKGLRAYDRTGKLVKTSSLTQGNLRRYTYKQAPGDDNSLGYVKFNLPNPWDIYLHDTPHRLDFGKRYRALSSGCIRLQQPQEMAVYILSELEHLKFNQDKLDTMIKTHKTNWKVLKTRIPVHIAYLTAFEDTTGKHIQFLNDVYNRDEKLISLLGKK